MIIGSIPVEAETGGSRDPEILLKSVAYNIILQTVIAPEPEQTENILRPGFHLAREKPAVLEKDKGFAVQGIMKYAGSIKIRIRPAYKPVAQVFKDSDAILTCPGKQVVFHFRTMRHTTGENGFHPLKALPHDIFLLPKYPVEPAGQKPVFKISHIDQLGRQRQEGPETLPAKTG